MKKAKILSIKNETHNVIYLKTEKPKDINFQPGQAVDFAINEPKWKDEVRPFTFTSLPEDDFLEFNIKVYPEHNGVTEQVSHLKQDNEILLGDVFGEIEYKGEGLFIAGGAGITPFIAILKDLKQKNKVGNNQLIFANKTSKDIINQTFFENTLGKNFTNVLSDEKKDGYEHGFITKEIIEKHLNNSTENIYVCGPPPMMDAVLKALKELDIDDSKIINEEY